MTSVVVLVLMNRFNDSTDNTWWCHDWQTEDNLGEVQQSNIQEVRPTPTAPFIDPLLFP